MVFLPLQKASEAAYVCEVCVWARMAQVREVRANDLLVESKISTQRPSLVQVATFLRRRCIGLK